MWGAMQKFLGRFSAALLIGLVIAANAVPVHAQSQSATRECNGSDGDAAIRACSRLLKLRHWSANERSSILNRRAYVYSTNNDYDRAIRDLDEAIRLNPKFVNLYIGRAVIYNKKGDFDQAIRDFGKAIRLDPKDAGNYVDRAVAYNKKHHYEMAIRDLDEAIRLNPRNAVAYHYRGSS